MMSRKIVLYIFSGQSARMRSFGISKNRMLLLAGLLAVGFAGLVFVFLDHANVRQQRQTTLKMKQESALLQDEIDRQRRQIDYFSNEIQSLNSRLLALSEMKKEIRAVANLTAPPDSANLFGVGGPALNEITNED